MQFKLTRIIEIASCAMVGTVAAITTPLMAAQINVPEVLPGSSFMQSIAYVLVSVLVTGFVTSWVNRAGGKKTKEETNELILRNTKLLLDMKETEVNTYRSKIEEFMREIDSLKRDIKHLSEENERLLYLIGKMALELERHQSSDKSKD